MKKLFLLGAMVCALGMMAGCHKEEPEPLYSDTTPGGSPSDTIPMPPDTIPMPPDTIPTPPDTIPAVYDYTFDGYTRTFAGQQLPYRIARIGDVQGGTSRLVIYLHGGTSRGSDNEAQLAEPAVDSIAHYLARQSLPSVFLVPQCPSGGNWDAPRMRGALRMLLLSYVDSGYVDQSRIYILGGSMGGTGTWSILSAYPRLFAAGMPCAGNPSRASADSIALTPVYTVMGTADNIMSIPTVEAFLAQLDSLGATYLYDAEQGWTHQQTCIESYTTPRLNWLFSHQNN